MIWREVKSSTVAACHYDADKKMLWVRFLTGAEYNYADVPLAVYHALLEAPSAGSFVHKHIQPFYAGVRVEAETKGA